MPRTLHKARGSDYFALSGCPVAAVRVRIARGDRISHPHDLTEREHVHDFRELVLVVRGEARHRLQGRDYPVRSGDVYMLQERSRHFFHGIRELELINIMYDASRLPFPQDQLRQLPGYSALFLLEPQYRQRHRFSSRLRLGVAALDKARAIGDDMVREAASGLPGRGVLLYARLLELMTFLGRQYGRATTVERRELLRIGEVIGALERDFARAWTIREMCAMAHLSRSTFLRTFRRAVGCPPLEFLQERRIREAERRLRETAQTVTEIAYACGFSDSNYFARQFRRRRGLTPSAYRCR